VTGKLARLLSAPQALPALVFLFFASILFLPDAYDVFGALLVAWCLAAIFIARPRVFNGLDWMFVGSLFCYPLLMLPSAFAMGANYSYFDYPIRVLLFIPIVMGLRTKADPLLVSRGFFLGGSVGGLGGACFSAYSLLSHPGVRVGDPITNPIPFGQIAAALSLIAFVSIFQCTRRWEKLLSVFGFLGGIVTLYASGSSGALLGFGFGLLVVLVFVSRKRLTRAIWLGIAVLLGVAFCIVAPVLLFKFHQLGADLDAYASGAGMGTSQGQRLILWGISLREIVHSPWFGVGPGHFRDALLRFCADANCPIGFLGFNHVHSQYFDSALNAGLIGLFGLLLSLVSPVVLFYRQIAFSTGPAQGASITGLAVVVAAMVSMVSQPLYAHNISVIFYVFTISICWFLALSTPRVGA
jgi:O-antigen ligase